ncbi:tape measure domain-containing protein [Propionispora hippei DSM 15287]|uniref:Tape measure domain-containing protein n=2 Tax=Propionispora TaxID=112902 RepID=A0A1M6GRT8_9FIRM|nr:tape measure domain-containing protein [Propionispora hippei DSM 15287]
MTIFIGGDNSDFLKKWESTKRALRKGLGSEAMAASESIATGLAAATAALAAFGVASIKLAGDMDASRKALTTLLGDAKAAEKMLADLATFAADTPFELPGLLTASKKLLAFGFASQDIIPMLAAIGDAAAMLGIGEEGISRLTNAIGQMQAKGKVSAEEMMQLAEAGVPAWKFLADAIGKDIPTAMKMAEQGAIDSTTGINALLMGMQSKFQGGMEAMSKTIPGLMSTIKDNVSMVMVEIGDSIAKNLNLVEKLQGVADWLSQFAAAVKALGLKEALQGMIPPEVIASVFVLSGALLGAAVPAMVALGIATWTALAPLLSFIAIGAAVGLLAYEIWVNWEPLSELFSTLWSTVTDIFTDAWNAITNVVDNAVTTVTTAISDAWNAIVSFTVGIWNSIVTTLSEAWNWITVLVEDALSSVAQFIGDGWNAAGEATSSVWNGIVDFIDGAWASIKELVAQGINWIVDKLSPLKSFFAQFIPDSVGNWFNKVTEGIGKIGAVAGKFSFGFSRKDISALLPQMTKPNTKFTGLTNATPATASPTTGGGADKEYEKLQKKAEQASKAIEKEWLQLTATQMDALEAWYADELDTLNESKDANENYERDVLCLNEIYTAKKKKILLDEQKENNRIADQASDLARSLSDKLGGLGLTGVDKQKFDIATDATRQIDEVRKKYRDLALEYSASTADQQDQFRKAWETNGIQFSITEIGMVDFCRQAAAEQVAIEAEKSKKIKDLHYDRVKFQEELDRARADGDVAKFQQLLTTEQAMFAQDLAGKQQYIDTYYEVWKGSHKSSMEIMAQQMAGTYDGLKGFFSDILTGTKSIGEAWQALGKSIMKIIADMAAQWLASQITMSLFPALAPAKSRGGISGIPGQYAAGGNYSGGLALVGEKGPELINFNRGGYVFTAAETKKMLSQSADSRTSRPMVITMNITTPDAASFRRSQSQILAEANAALAMGRRNL